MIESAGLNMAEDGYCVPFISSRDIELMAPLEGGSRQVSREGQTACLATGASARWFGLLDQGLRSRIAAR